MFVGLFYMFILVNNIEVIFIIDGELGVLCNVVVNVVVGDIISFVNLINGILLGLVNGIIIIDKFLVIMGNGVVSIVIFGLGIF